MRGHNIGSHWIIHRGLSIHGSPYVDRGIIFDLLSQRCLWYGKPSTGQPGARSTFKTICPASTVVVFVVVVVVVGVVLISHTCTLNVSDFPMKIIFV